jgi:hypothetical protein
MEDKFRTAGGLGPRNADCSSSCKSPLLCKQQPADAVIAQHLQEELHGDD